MSHRLCPRLPQSAQRAHFRSPRHGTQGPSPALPAQTCQALTPTSARHNPSLPSRPRVHSPLAPLESLEIPDETPAVKRTPAGPERERVKLRVNDSVHRMVRESFNDDSVSEFASYF